VESILGDGVGLVRLGIGGGREFGLAEAGPDRRLGSECMSQVDEFFSGNGTIRPFKIGFRSERSRRNDEANRRQEQRPEIATSNSHSSSPFSGIGWHQPSAVGLTSEARPFLERLCTNMTS